MSEPREAVFGCEGCGHEERIDIEYAEGLPLKWREVSVLIRSDEKTGSGHPADLETDESFVFCPKCSQAVLSGIRSALRDANPHE